MIMNVEIEIKLRIPPAAVAKLQRHPLLISSNRPVRLISTYYDTPALDLKSKAIALRLRKEGKRWVQTIKGGGSMLAGAHTRHEWDTPVARNALDFTKLEDPALIGIFGNADLRQRLNPVFVTEFTRKTVPLTFGESQIEFCLDRGTIVSGEREETISEIELELKSGNTAALFDFALELQKTVPLFIEDRSKAERGYALYMGKAWNSVKKAWVVDLDRKMDVGEAFREIVKGCLLQVQANMKGFLDREEDCEYLHQMRVGLRRMRSAFSIFSHYFGRDVFSGLVPELRWLGGELGPARNWDVFMLETLPPVAAAMAADFRGLEQAASIIRLKRLEQAVQAVGSQRFQILMLGLGAAVSREGWPPGASSPISDFSDRILEKRYRSFEKGGRNIRALSPPELHALRISGKKLRYAAEFFSPLYPARASRAFLKAMAGLQDVLGAINDAATTNHLIDELSGIDQAPASLLRGWVACETAHRLDQLEGEWTRFADLAPFWK